MMKWGKKKPSSSSSSSSSSHPHMMISHVFPLSWLSKFKQTSEKPASGIMKKSRNEKQNSQRVNPRSPKCCASAYRDSRFYSQDEDGFWRLSFGEEDMGGGEDTKLVASQRYCGNCKTSVKEAATKKKSQMSNKKHAVQEKREAEKAKEQSLQRTYRRIIEATSELQRELDEVKVGYRKSLEYLEKDAPELELLMQMVGGSNQRSPSPQSGRQWCDQEQNDQNALNARLELQQVKDAKIKEFLAKGEKQRKSFHMKQCKVRVQSPRTPSKTETCRAKALEDFKKAKMMKKKKMKEKALEEKAAALESCAMVKCSRDPQQDFRDSMLEMIKAKRIRRAEELEELLACYLTLNADEYHDLIIKVFRQVWCELEEAALNQKST